MRNRSFLPAVFVILLLSTFTSTSVLALAYCDDICTGTSPCDAQCWECEDPPDCDVVFLSTCGSYGVCDYPTLPDPTVTITQAAPKKFPIPYGYGLTMSYTIDLEGVSGRVADSVTTQYSPNGGSTWYTDEAARSPSYNWDNIHGDLACDPTTMNLQSNHTYSLRIILNYHDSDGQPKQQYSNTVTETVEDYAYLCGDDEEWDGLPDSLESAIAWRYFPQYWMRWYVSDVVQWYGTNDPVRTGKIPFSVRSVPSGNGRCTEDRQCLEVKYAMAYHRDCGDDPWGGCSGSYDHDGDSEFYAIMVARSSPNGSTSMWGVPWATARTSVSYWYLTTSYAASHEGTSTDGSTYSYYAKWPQPAVIYVAEGKHAAYHTIGSCDAGGFLGSDYCAANYNGRNYMSESRLLNVGNPDSHSGISSLIRYPNNIGNPTPAYDVWGGADFADSSPYDGKFERDMKWTRVSACIFDDIQSGNYCCTTYTIGPGSAAVHCVPGCFAWACPYW